MRHELRVEPITEWPGKATAWPTASPFSHRTTYSQTRVLLDRELDMLGASVIVLQMYVKPSDVRRDGAMREDRRPEKPGVILSFRSPRGQLRFACDQYVNWRHNVRAIALGMEALRKIDRYGITADGEQYRGFAALESAESARGFTSKEEAARFIVTSALAAEDGDLSEGSEKVDRLTDAMLMDEELAGVYYRRAATNAHPDKGGTDEWMARLAAARAVVEG